MADVLPNVDFEFHLPPFADESLRQLAREIQKKRGDLARVTALDNEQNERGRYMEDHCRLVRLEINQTQALFEARKTEVQAEDHMARMSLCEKARLDLELKEIESDISSKDQEIQSFEKVIAKKEAKIEKLKQGLNITNNEFGNWLKSQQEKDEDHRILEKYTREDAKRITDLTLKIQRLSTETAKRKRQLKEEMTEIHLKRVELEKSARLFKQLHVERKELLKQWESTLTLIQNRDSDLAGSQNLKHALEERISEARIAVREFKFQLEDLEAKIEAIDRNTTALDRTASLLNNEYHAKKSDLESFKNELETLKSTLMKTNAAVRNQTKSNESIQNDLVAKQHQLERETARKADVEKRLAEVKSLQATSQQTADELEDLIRKETKQKAQLDAELAGIRAEYQKDSRVLHDLKEEETKLSQNIVSSKIALRNLKSINEKLDEQAIGLETVLYGNAFKVQQLESKIRRLQGERSEEEKLALKGTIEKLEVDLSVWTRKVAALNADTKRAEDELKKSRRNLAKMSVDNTKLVENISELSLYIELTTKALNEKVCEKEDLMVEESILRLEMKKLKSQYNEQTTEIVSSETRRSQIQKAIEERLLEVEAYKDILRVRAKIAEEERSGTASLLYNNVTKLQKLKVKYEVIMMKLSEDDHATDDHAKIMIKAAQYKEDLRMERDELMAKLDKVEEEFAVLGKTLNDLQNHNQSFRELVNNQKVNQADQQLKIDLEQKWNGLMQRYREKRRALVEIQQDVEELAAKISEAEQQRSSQMKSLETVEKELTRVKQDIEEQTEKKVRAEKLCSKFVREWREKKSVKEQTPEELDINLKELKESNHAIYTEIADYAEKDPITHSTFLTLCAKKFISPPTAPTSTASSRLSSRASSRSAASAVSPSRKTETATSTTCSVSSKRVSIGTDLDSVLPGGPSEKLKQRKEQSRPSSKASATAKINK